MNHALIKVISRQSKLALIQVQEVFSQFPDLDYELVKTDAYGDKNKHISLLENPPADIFTRELDEAILAGTADIAIHSAKDLPYPLPEGLEVITLFEAFDQSDALVSRDNLTLRNLPYGARIGTSSPTRKKELLIVRPDAEVVSIRGTIEERIAQVDSGFIDALIVATCALKRLQLTHRIAEILPFATHPLQGNLAIVARNDRDDLKSVFADKDIRKNYGKVSLVGFGPGNPDLLTILGEKKLAEADVIFHDDLLDKDFLEKYPAEKIYVGKRKDKHSFEQAEINQLLLSAAQQGKNVVRLKGGDPMIFAHGREEIDYLQSNFVETKVIPGISAGIAAAAFTKIPLTHRSASSSVAFVTGHSETTRLPDADTVVIYMGGSNIRSIAEKAIQSGRTPETPVMLVSSVSTPKQQEFYSTLKDLSQSEEKYPTPVVIIVGEVVALRQKPDLIIRKDKYLITGTYTEHFRQLGDIVHQPLIEIRPILPNLELERVLNRLIHFEWLIFTSRYSVQFFFQTLEKQGKDTRLLNGLKIASVGKITSQELRLHGIIPDLQPEDESSEGLLNLFQTNKIQPSEVFIPRSYIGLPVLPEGLRALGFNVLTVSLYSNVFPEDIDPLDLTAITHIVFSSPSCVTNFLKLYGTFPTDKAFIFRGKETEKRFKELNSVNLPA